jgi:hypothetical protein
VSAIEQELQNFDRRFLLATGSIDLLRMATELSPAEFRRYIELSRQWRAARRAGKAA